MIFVIALAFIACCSNVVFLEVLIREDPGCGNLVTCFQFMFVALEGFMFTTDFGRKKPIVPIRKYYILVAMFFVVSVSNNYALNFDISMPLHMIFRSGSLVANMVIGMIILKRRYTLSKYLSVLMITVGIFIATFASQSIKASEDKHLEAHEAESSLIYYLIGILLLTIALFISAGLGVYQEKLYANYGKYPKEALFYSHALPLPGFLLIAHDIYNHSILFSSSAPISIPLIGHMPKLWLFLLANVLTQYVCIRSVFTISTVYSSLTVTMIITLRKFLSLIFSIVYFKNPFTTAHWFGTFLVFAGTLLFTDIWKVTEVQKQKVKTT